MELSDLLKLLKYFSATAIAAFVKIQFAAFSGGWAIVFPNNLALYLKDLELSSITISALKLVASSLKWNHKPLVVSD